MIRPSATLTIALTMTAGLAASAHAQCSVYRLGMPDFDQRRSVLPDSGRMYCVPTATANALAYIANHGQPAVFGGPRDWQSQSQYEYMNTQLTTMGLFMGTDPDAGTSLLGWRLTTQAYVRNGDGLLVGSYQASGERGVNPLQMANHMRMGSIVMPIIGWYDQLDVNRWERDGGHVVTMWGGSSLCGDPEDMRLLFRDPGNDVQLFDQSPFATTQTTFTTNANWRFKYASESQYFSRPIYRLSANNGFLDGFLYILPAFGLTTDPITGDIDAHVPLPFTDEPGARVFDFDPIPAFTSIIALDQGLTPIEAFVITQPDRTRAGTLHAVDVIEGVMEPIDAITAPRGVVTGNNGSIYVAAAGDLLRYTPQAGGGYAITGNRALPFPVDAMMFDDVAGEVLAISVDGRRLMRISAALALLENAPLPAGVDLDGEASIAVDPEDRSIWIATSNVPALTRLTRDAAGRLMIAAQPTLPGIDEPHAVQFGDDGALYVVQSQRVHAFDLDGASGPRAADRPLVGLRTGPIFRVGRGRTNHDAATMDDINRLPPVDVEGQPDCRADLDLDGVLTIFDFLEFQNLFSSGSTWADFDYDGRLTIFDFLAFQNAFAAGC